MKTNKPKSDWEKELIRLELGTNKCDQKHGQGVWELNDLADLFRSVIKQAKQEGIEEAIKLSDEIEAGKDTTLEEWKAFKCFRNTLRDKFELKKKKGIK